MSRFLAFLAVLILPLAGCIQDPGSTDTPAGTDDAAAPPAPLPDRIEESKTVSGGVDPFNFATNEPCSQDVSSCDRYPFTLQGDADVSAVLTWGVDASDFDLYIFKGGNQVATSGNTPPGTSESITTSLGAGDYEAVVVSWAVAQDTFTLVVEFAQAS